MDLGCRSLYRLLKIFNLTAGSLLLLLPQYIFKLGSNILERCDPDELSGGGEVAVGKI